MSKGGGLSRSLTDLRHIFSTSKHKNTENLSDTNQDLPETETSDQKGRKDNTDDNIKRKEKRRKSDKKKKKDEQKKHDGKQPLQKTESYDISVIADRQEWKGSVRSRSLILKDDTDIVTLLSQQEGTRAHKEKGYPSEKLDRKQYRTRNDSLESVNFEYCRPRTRKESHSSVTSDHPTVGQEDVSWISEEEDSYNSDHVDKAPLTAESEGCQPINNAWRTSLKDDIQNLRENSW